MGNYYLNTEFNFLEKIKNILDLLYKRTKVNSFIIDYNNTLIVGNNDFNIENNIKNIEQIKASINSAFIENISNTDNCIINLNENEFYFLFTILKNKQVKAFLLFDLTSLSNQFEVNIFKSLKPGLQFINEFEDLFINNLQVSNSSIYLIQNSCEHIQDLFNVYANEKFSEKNNLDNKVNNLVETETANSYDNLNILFNALEAVIVGLNSNGNVVVINEYGKVKLGCSNEEINNKNWFEVFYHPMFNSLNSNDYFTNNLLCLPDKSEYFVNTKFGQPIYCKWQNIDVSSDNSSIKYLCVGIDDTKRYFIDKTHAVLARSGYDSLGLCFFDVLTNYLNELFRCFEVAVCEIESDEKGYQILSKLLNNVHDFNFTEINNYLIENQNLEIIVTEFNNVFNIDQTELNLDKIFACIFLKDFMGNVLGCIYLVCLKQTANPEMLIGILKMLAVRAAGELERKRGEKFLFESKRLTEKILETTPDLVYIYDLNENKNIYSNKETLSFLGYTSDEISKIGSELFNNILHPDDFDVVKAHHDKCKSNTTDILEVEYRMKDARGEWKWLHSRDKAYFVDSSGNVSQIIGTASDVTANKTYELELLESEKKFRTLFDFAVDSFFLHDFSGNLIDVNKTACESLEYTYDELIKMKVPDIDMGFNLEELNNLWIEIIKNGPLTLESNQKTKSGKLIPVEIKVSRFSSGSNNLFFASTRDISERKKIEQALIASAQIANSIPSGLLVYQFEKPDNLYLIDANPAAINITGIDFENLYGVEFLQVWTGEQSVEIKNKYLKVIETSEAYYANDLVYEDDKIQGAYKIIAFKMPGEKLGIAFDDVSEKLIAERALIHAKNIAEEKEKILSSYLENAPVGVFLVNEFGDYLSANPKAAEITGFPIQDLCKMNIIDLIVPGEVDEVYKNFVSLQNTGKFSGSFNFIRKDEQIRHWMVEAVKLNDNLFLSFSIDITDRNNMELELIKAKEKAEQSDKLKTSFLQNMSHEIRTPLNGIMGFSSLLKDFENLEIEERTEFVNLIINSSKRLLGIVDDVLQIARLDTGILNIVNSRFKLFETVKYFNYLYKDFISDKGLKFNLEFNLPLNQIELNTDKDKFYQIIVNLFNNAIKFTPAGYLEFGGYFNETGIVLYLKDTGIGIKTEYLSKIFDRFWQVEAFTEKKFGGTGLGLSISKGLAILLGFDLIVESTYGYGSIFKILIPKSNYQINDLSILEINEIEDRQIDLANYKILIADDEEMNYIYLKKMFPKDGPKIYWAKTGREAIELIRKYDIDLVLLDLKMPIMNGFEAASKIRDLRPDLPIIAQTAYSQLDEKESALNAGCTDFISKPIEKIELFKLIKKVLFK